MGLDLIRFPSPSEYASRRAQLFELVGVDLVFDVGANTGQYALEIRSAGYKGRIVSFEPIKQAFIELERVAAGDHAWTAMNLALGDAQGRADVNISKRTPASSLLNPLPAQLAAAPSSVPVRTESVDVTTLDDVADRFLPRATRPLLKLDVQGYERHVLSGARDSLPRFCGIEIEISLIHLYDGDMTILECLELLTSKDFEAVWIQPGLIDQSTGRLLQCDGLFFDSEILRRMQPEPE